jgi:murein L,D-transpeptidase YcbB/YkuD
VDAGAHRQTVNLPRSIPVYLYYLTAWVDGSGELQLREDIYERDKLLLEALAKDI